MKNGSVGEHTGLSLISWVNLANCWFSGRTAEEEIARLHAKAVPPAQAQNMLKVLEREENEAKKKLEDTKERQRQFDAVVQTHGDEFLKLVKSINRMKLEEEALDDMWRPRFSSCIWMKSRAKLRELNTLCLTCEWIHKNEVFLKWTREIFHYQLASRK